MAKKKRKPDNHKKSHQTHSGKEKAGIDFESQAKKQFKQRLRDLRSGGHIDPEMFEGLDYDSTRQKRRIQAMSAMLEEVKTRVRDVCPEVPFVFDIATEWIEINLYPAAAYDYEERFTFSALGAAIWILDQIKEAGRLSDLMLILKPADERAAFFIPSVWDPCHSLDVIKSMVERIYFRNESEDYGMYPGELCRLYMTDAVAKGEIDHTLPNRSAFDEILALIPEDAIKSATERYQAQYWNWIIRYFKGRSYYVRQEVILKEALEDLYRRVDGYHKEGKAIRNELKPLYSKPGPSSIPFDPNLLMDQLQNSSRDHDLRMKRSFSLEAEYNSLERKLDDLLAEICDYEHRCAFFVHKRYEDIENEYSTEVADAWGDMDLGDPYELCFAFLYLLDSGSDLPWCYFAGANLLTAFCSMLPWPRTRFNTYEDGIWYHTDPETGETLAGPEEYSLPKRIRVPEPDNWLQMKYSDSADDNDLYNLGQILYEVTGCIMPRKLDRYHPAFGTLDRYGIRGKQALRPPLYCMSLLGEVKNQTKPYYASLRYIPDEEELEPEEDVSVEELRSQLAALREENKRLKQQAYDSGREVRDEKDRYEALAQKVANDAQELHDLRELIFNQQSEQYETAVATKSIQYPYRTDKRIVVFGGHDTWAKEMRPKFPDVRFIDRGMVPNTDLIRRADVVWIQPNALSHAYYYKIIDEVRRSNVRVRYFSYASAVKCAEQIVLDDKNS